MHSKACWKCSRNRRYCWMCRSGGYTDDPKAPIPLPTDASVHPARGAHTVRYPGRLYHLCGNSPEAGKVTRHDQGAALPHVSQNREGQHGGSDSLGMAPRLRTRRVPAGGGRLMLELWFLGISFVLVVIYVVVRVYLEERR